LSDRPPQQSAPAPKRVQGETLTISGTLALVNGAVAIQSDDITYYVLGLGQSIGFIDGLKEDASVEVSGTTTPASSDSKTLRVTTLTFNGKDYDLSGRGLFAAPPPAPAPRIQRETVTISGTLALVNSAVAIQSDDITYYVLGLGQYIGFIDGLKEDASVEVSGTAFATSSDSKALRVTTLTFNGKDYDLSSRGQFAPPPPAPGKRRAPPSAPQKR
jgi:hypothetical protein